MNKKNDNIVFVSSLPRSGSTLMMNLLNQNPNHYATPTSGLIELVLSVKNSWRNFIEFKAEGLDVVKPRVMDSMSGLMYGYFEKELDKGKIVFDKSRGWLQYIEVLEAILDRPVKIIVMVRDVRAIVASFEKIYRKRGIDYIDGSGEIYFNAQTINGRAQEILKGSSVLGLTINRLRDAIERGMKDRLIFVPYQEFLKHPQDTMDRIHEDLGLDLFKYDPSNVKQTIYENDVWHGMDLHTIRNEIKTVDEIPWEGVLPNGLLGKIENEYSDINKLSRLNYIF